MAAMTHFRRAPRCTAQGLLGCSVLAKVLLLCIPSEFVVCLVLFSGYMEPTQTKGGGGS